MRTAAKVFIWFGIIFGFYLIYPLIVGIFALKKLNHCDSKQELQSFGIITLFFCSFLGGLFMMLTDYEPQNMHCKNTTVVTYKKDIISNSSIQQNNTGTASVSTKTCVWSIIFLSILCLVFSILIVIFPPYYFEQYWYTNVAWDFYIHFDDFWAFFSAIPIWCNTVIILIPISMFFYNKQRIDKKCEIAFIIYLIYAATTFSIHISSTAIVSNHYRTAMMWIVSTLSFIIFILTLVIIITNKSALKTGTYKKVKEVKTKLEIELDKIKQLYDSNVVTQLEYEKMRQTIIEKYYNV